MFKSLLSLLFICLFNTSLFASEQRNLVYIVMEGVSRPSFYGLLQKGKLPGFSAIVENGNVRNAELDQMSLNNDHAALHMYSGINPKEEQLTTDNINVGMSFYSQVNLLRPDLDIAFFLTSPLKRQYHPFLQAYLAEHLNTFSNTSLTYRPSEDIGKEFVSYVATSDIPFFAIVNFTNIDYVANRYREGTELYSQAIQNCDRALYKMVMALKEKGVFEHTDFFITTTTGYHYQEPFRNHKIWFASSRKIMRKGNQWDVFPTLLDFLGLSNSSLSSGYSGESLLNLTP